MKPDRPSDPSNRAMETPAAAHGPAAEGAPDDRALVARAREGDEEAFRMLVERHRDRAHALADRILRSAPDAEEVAQDAFVRAWRALPGFRGEAAFGTWLHRIVVRRALDRAAVLRNRRARESHAEEMDSLAVVEGRDAGEAARERRMSRLVARLPEAQRAAVTLYYLEDRSVENVASLLGLPENTVKTHLSRARAALRRAWTAGGEG